MIGNIVTPVVNVGTATMHPAFTTPASVRVHSLSCPSNHLCTRRRLYSTPTPTSPFSISRNVDIIQSVKKSGGSSKRSKKQRSSSPARKSSSSSSSSMLGSMRSPGPLSPELLDQQQQQNDSSSTTEGSPENTSVDIPSIDKRKEEEEEEEGNMIDMDKVTENVTDDVQNIPKLTLPDINVTKTGIKRKRRPNTKTKISQKHSDEKPVKKIEKDLSLKRIRELTRAYRLGSEGREELINELEKEPDFILQQASAAEDYDLTSAIFGTGKPNKQGIYILPYLQSAHLVLLSIALLVAFVYYPGFPLTESTDEVRQTFKNSLVVVFIVNSILSVLAYKSAGKRDQPQLFWAIKTFILGDLAFGELRRNTKIISDETK